MRGVIFLLLITCVLLIFLGATAERNFRRHNNIEEKPDNKEEKPDNIEEKPDNIEEKPDNREEKPDNIEEKPDPNESWKTWAKRKACEVASIECCMSPFVRINTILPYLRNVLEKEFFGQHIALETIMHALEGHVTGEPRRALVLSFHGWVGSGKTYLSQHIAKALYRNGENSRFYKHFTQGYDFPSKNISEAQIESYRKDLQAALRERAMRCERALFVFDEVDNMPSGVLEALTPFIDHPGIVDGINFRKSIFIFINNAGGNKINQIAFEAWKSGKSRTRLTLRDFENFVESKVFNENGTGLYRSALLDKRLVDFVIPFLPLEKGHVMKCIKHEAELQGVKDQDLRGIADQLDYWPSETPAFSNSGCKKIEKLVFLWKSKRKWSSQTKQEL